MSYEMKKAKNIDDPIEIDDELLDLLLGKGDHSFWRFCNVVVESEDNLLINEDLKSAKMVCQESPEKVVTYLGKKFQLCKKHYELLESGGLEIDEK